MADNCCCGGGVKLIYTCSGAANTGYLADRVARKLRDEKKGCMTCLSAIGAELSGYVESAKQADKNIIIDGCPVSCGKKIFEKLGISYTQFIMTDFGVQKGKTEITEEIIKNISNQISNKI